MQILFLFIMLFAVLLYNLRIALFYFSILFPLFSLYLCSVVLLFSFVLFPDSIFFFRSPSILGTEGERHAQCYH